MKSELNKNSYIINILWLIKLFQRYHLYKFQSNNKYQIGIYCKQSCFPLLGWETDTTYVLAMLLLLLSLFFVVYGLFAWKWMYEGLCLFVYICIVIGDQSIQERGGWFQMSGWTPSLVCASSKHWLGYLTPCAVVCVDVQRFDVRSGCCFDIGCHHWREKKHWYSVFPNISCNYWTR